MNTIKKCIVQTPDPLSHILDILIRLLPRHLIMAVMILYLVITDRDTPKIMVRKVIAVLKYLALRLPWSRHTISFSGCGLTAVLANALAMAGPYIKNVHVQQARIWQNRLADTTGIAPKFSNP